MNSGKFHFRKWDNWWYCIAVDPYAKKNNPAYYVFMFTPQELGTMHRYYRAGNAPISIKGLFRYGKGYLRLRGHPPSDPCRTLISDNINRIFWSKS